MPKLSEAEIIIHRSNLEKWQSPIEMNRYAQGVNRHMGGLDFFRQPGISFVREAIVAGEFGELRNVTSVRLAATDPPDFEAVIHGHVVQFECTEAIEPGRMRGDEYASTARRRATGEWPVVDHEEPEDWARRAAKIPKALKKAVDRKLQKPYPPECELVIYLSIDDGFGTWNNEVVRIIPVSIRHGVPHFRRVWVLWKKQVYLVE